ncbi:MAG: PAS domain-containing sensor histidine kinase [Anaerolineae bacterium]|nr:PAS domain-containing sensor histidine kinase [Anaerolineae bacterium]
MFNQKIYEFIFRSTADGILIADSNNSLIAANPAAVAMLRLTVEELIGKKIDQCLRHNHELVNLFNRCGDQVMDVHLPKRRLAVGVATRFKDGKRLVLLQDVTEQRDLESRRKALVTAVAHDLRNPISAISGYAELVAKFGDLNENQQRFNGRIQQTALKIHELAEPLVDLAWIEAGLPLAHVPIQLSDLIKQAVMELSSLAASQRVTIAISVQAPMPPIMGDPTRIQIAIAHLLHNAISYSEPEETVAIHAWSDTHEAYCSVADQGIGIADDELDLIFDRLYRSRDARVQAIPGGGLGLTISRTIIKRHGGDIWASSNLDAGSTFTFVLPTVSET